MKKQKIEVPCWLELETYRLNSPVLDKKGRPFPRRAVLFSCLADLLDHVHVNRAQLAAVFRIWLNLIGDLLPLVEGAVASPLDRREVDEYIAAPVVIRDKAVALLCVEPFHSA